MSHAPFAHRHTGDAIDEFDILGQSDDDYQEAVLGDDAGDDADEEDDWDDDWDDLDDPDEPDDPDDDWDDLDDLEDDDVSPDRGP
jgi:hypothetical protein